jgi:hypothetical protein
MFKKIFAVFASLGVLTSSIAQPAAPAYDSSVSNLMVVLRESLGSNKQDEKLVSMGKAKVRLQDGREVEIDNAWYSYIGDMHIRFVFDTPTMMVSASSKDFERLNLTPEAAVDIAMTNIKRVYGAPRIEPWNDLWIVKGKSSDVDSSYFLDRNFWREQAKKYPEGLVVSVAKRGGLLFTPASDEKAVAGLKKGVAYLHSSSERARISSALYLFKDDQWSVFQPAVKVPE